MFMNFFVLIFGPPRPNKKIRIEVSKKDSKHQENKTVIKKAQRTQMIIYNKEEIKDIVFFLYIFSD